MKTLIIGPDTDYEREVTVPEPLGKKARKLMPKLLKFVTTFSAIKGGADGKSEEELVEILDTFWDTEEIEEKFIPYIFGMTSVKDRKWLENNGTSLDIMVPFFEGVMYFVNQSLGREDVQDALGKSNEEEPEVLQAE